MRARLDVGRGKKVRSECTAMYILEKKMENPSNELSATKVKSKIRMAFLQFARLVFIKALNREFLADQQPHVVEQFIILSQINPQTEET